MLGKLVVVVVAVGACGLSLVVVRELRVRADEELARAHLRGVRLDAELWRLRSQIASRLTPEQIRERAEPLGELEPVLEPSPEPAREFMADNAGRGAR